MIVEHVVYSPTEVAGRAAVDYSEGHASLGQSRFSAEEEGYSSMMFEKIFGVLEVC